MGNEEERETRSRQRRRLEQMIRAARQIRSIYIFLIYQQTHTCIYPGPWP